MSHATSVSGDVGVGRDERSMLTGVDIMMDDTDEKNPVQRLLSVLGRVKDLAESVQQGEAPPLWSDECMNQLILGVELGLSQGWGEVVDGFSDTGRILQSYESASRAAEAPPFLLDAYAVLCQLSQAAIEGNVPSKLTSAWRDRYQEELATLEKNTIALASDDDVADEDSGGSPFEIPDMSQSQLGNLRPNDDELPTLDELPPLDSMLGGAGPDKTSGDRTEINDDARELVDAFGTASDPLIDAETDTEPASADDAQEPEVSEISEDVDVSAYQGVQPSKVVVDFVDRVCDEMANFGDRDEGERILSMEMIQGGIAALKREATNDGYTASAELCDEMTKACLFVSQSVGDADERFTDMGFGFCGVFVEAMNYPASENVAEWRSECLGLIDEWAERLAEEVHRNEATPETSMDANAPGAAQQDAPAPGPVVETDSQDNEKTPEAGDVAREEASDSAKEPTVETIDPDRESSPKVSSMPSDSLELFARAQEALTRGDGETAKSLALEAAALIAESEVEKAERQLRDAEGRMKESINATENTRGDVKHAEKLVMNAASDVASCDTNLGKAKSHTGKMLNDLEESEAEVSELERQIAELQALRDEQLKEVSGAKGRLDEARTQESGAESALEIKRESEKSSRKELEGARQQVKEYQRVTAEIESEMEKAREALSRKRSSLADISQTIHRPVPIKTDGDGTDEHMLF